MYISSGPKLGRWDGRGVGFYFCKEKDSFKLHLLSVNAHTPLSVIYFPLQIVLIPGKMDLKFTEMNATEMYVVNLKSHIIAFHSKCPECHLLAT